MEAIEHEVGRRRRRSYDESFKRELQDLDGWLPTSPKIRKLKVSKSKVMKPPEFH